MGSSGLSPLSAWETHTLSCFSAVTALWMWGHSHVVDSLSPAPLSPLNYSANHLPPLIYHIIHALFIFSFLLIPPPLHNGTPLTSLLTFLLGNSVGAHRPPHNGPL